MPLAFLAALAGSLAIHAAALFLPDVDLSTIPPEPPPVVAEIQPRPPASAPALVPAARPKAPPAPRPEHRPAKPAKVPAAAPAQPAPPLATAQPEAVPGPQAMVEPEPQPGPEPDALADEALAERDPRLPGRGRILFNVYKGSGGLLVGRAEHSWEFGDGHYRMEAVTETVGLAALVKPIRIELESRGSLTPQGLQPERFSTRRNGSETNEYADFDWDSGQVTLGRDGSRRPLGEGAQDLLSFHYQFGYLAHPESGVGMGVATGKKFETYRFEPVGEENIDTPAGRFRTLHVRVRNDSTTELWLALDQLMLPVKIRHTDRKGESFEQVATELGV